MKKVLYSLLFALLAVCDYSVVCQESSIVIPKITMADMGYVFDKDPDAEAIVLYDKGKTTFVPGGDGLDVMFARTTRIKIVKESKFDWSEVEIPFYNDGKLREHVFDITGYTYYLEDGRIMRTALDIESIYEEIDNEYWSTMKFAMPAVKEGAVIEYSYKLRSNRIYNVRDWQFQRSIPTVHSEFELRTIPFYEYAWLYQGDYKFAKQESYEARGVKRNWASVEFRDVVNIFVVKDILAYEDESFVASREDYICKLVLQLAQVNYPSGGFQKVLTTWAQLIKDFEASKTFGKYVGRSEKLAKKYIDVEAIRVLPLADRVSQVMDFVKQTCKWNGYVGTHTRGDPGDMLKSMTGTSAEINLFLVGLLKAVDVEAYPVTISTRSHGRIKYSYPFAHFFNYTLVLINTGAGVLLLDGTDPLLQHSQIPVRCINGKGLIIREGEVNWVALESTSPTESMTIIKMDLSEEKLEANVANVSFEYDAYSNRKKYGQNTAKILNDLKEKDYDVSEESIRVKNSQASSKPYSYSFVTSVDFEEFNGKVYISPFLGESVEENPFNQKNRSYPVDLKYPRKRIMRSNIKIGPDDKVDYVADGFKVSNDLFDFEYSASHNEHTVNVACSYYLKKTMYKASEYERLKWLFDKIIEKVGEKIVLIKS